jgi:hypothetical protein
MWQEDGPGPRLVEQVWQENEAVALGGLSMPKTSLSKLRSGNEKGGRSSDAGKNQANSSIRSRKVYDGKRTPIDQSDGRARPSRNSSLTRTLTENDALDETFQRAIDKNRGGSPREAAAILENLIRRFPACAPAYWYLGGIYLYELRLAKRAVAFFRKASRLAPFSERASLGMFHSLWHLGRERDAMDELRRFQAISSSQDYKEILAEIRDKAPELLATKKSKRSPLK